MKTNIENVVVFRDRDVYGYSVRYKSGRHKTTATGPVLVLPDTVHKFMVTATKSISHDEKALNYHDVVYYHV